MSEHTPEHTAASNGSQKVVGVALVALCGLAIILSLVFGFQRPTSSTASSSDSSNNVPTLLGKKNSLALIELSGPIFMDPPQDGGGLLPSETNALTVRKELDAAAENKNIKGILLRINSPGGTVGMSQELNAAVTRASKKKPVVASLGDMAASGGYYTACAADKIITNPGTLTASIGVIISTMNFKNLMENKLGVKSVTFKSGKFKDILSPYRDTTEDESKLMQKLIDDSYHDFLGAVLNGRTRHVKGEQKMTLIKNITAIADGRVVHGTDAVKVGLADEVGDMHHAYEVLDQMAKERFGIKGKDKLPLETSSRFPTLMDWLGINNSTTESSQMKMPKLQSPSAGQPYMQLMPLSVRYPNQPLWVLE